MIVAGVGVFAGKEVRCNGQALVRRFRRRVGRFTGLRLNTPHTARHRFLAGDQDHPEITGACRVGAAAELDARAHRHDAHDIAVLLAEEHHRAFFTPLFEWQDFGHHVVVRGNTRVRIVLDLAHLLDGRRLEV